MRPRLRAAALLFLAGALPGRALGNGAFPDSGQLLLPSDRPRTIVLGTNFGLLISEDGGTRWRWTCEHGAGDLGDRYALASEQRRLVGISPRALIVSEDLGCRWRQAGTQEDRLPFDFFTHPTDPAVALALTSSPRTGLEEVVEVNLLTDQPPKVLYGAPKDEQLTTVELAASDPRQIYATQNPVLSSARTRVVHSGDGGQTWTVVDPQGAPENIDLRIAAVDPANPRKLYFRAGTPLEQGEALLVSDDGGRTVRSVFTTRGALVAFLRLQAGGALLALMEGPMGRLYRLADDGTATELPGVNLAVRALAERDGLIYAATDNIADGFALAVSRDGGATFEGVMAFEDITEISRCGDLPAVCIGTCTQLAARAALPMSLCQNSDPGPAPEDGGAPAAVDAQPPGRAPDAGTTAPPPAGCSCRSAGGGPGGLAVLLLALLLARAIRRAPAALRPAGSGGRPAPRRTADRA
jgi:MYXO-CTERM domain-containing protein